MFRESRRKIVVAIMSVLILLFLGTLAVIYGLSYREVSESNREMLRRYVELYSLESQPGEGGHPADPLEPDTGILGIGGRPGSEDTPAFRLSTFYSVALSEGGEIFATDNDSRSVYSDDELVGIAMEIVNRHKPHGTKGNLIFLMEDKGGYTLVAFMDNTIMQGSMATLFRYTLVFGSVVIILFFFLAIYFAKWIVKPLEESYHRQKQFISDAGHELKTPVSVVSANAELLAREIGSNRWLSNIQYENERMGALITQLLELARTENVSPQMECIDFSRLAAGETLPFESVAFENGVILESNIEDDVQVSGNSIQLKQLISILLDNAIRHCQDGGAVGLALGKEKNTALLSVVNDGEEIPKDQRKKIFERFYRADQARNSESRNYGLGLAIAKAIVTVHRGRIEVLCHDGKVEFAVRIPCRNNRILQ